MSILFSLVVVVVYGEGKNTGKVLSPSDEGAKPDNDSLILALKTENAKLRAENEQSRNNNLGLKAELKKRDEQIKQLSANKSSEKTSLNDSLKAVKKEKERFEGLYYKLLKETPEKQKSSQIPISDPKRVTSRNEESEIIAISSDVLLIFGMLLVIVTLLRQVLSLRKKDDAVELKTSESKIVQDWEDKRIKEFLLEIKQMHQRLAEVSEQYDFILQELREITAHQAQVTTNVIKENVRRGDLATTSPDIIYVKSIDEKNAFYRINETRDASRFILQLVSKDATTAKFDINRDSCNYSAWLRDIDQLLQYGCTLVGDRPRTPVHSVTIEKGTAYLENGQWYVKTPLQLRLS